MLTLFCRFENHVLLLHTFLFYLFSLSPSLSLPPSLSLSPFPPSTCVARHPDGLGRILPLGLADEAGRERQPPHLDRAFPARQGSPRNADPAQQPVRSTTPLLCNGENIDFLYLIATMPGRHSGDQVHKVKQTAAPSFVLPFTVQWGKYRRCVLDHHYARTAEW